IFISSISVDDQGTSGEIDSIDGSTDSVQREDDESIVDGHAEATTQPNYSKWANLTEQDLARCFFLLTTTQSKAVIFLPVDPSRHATSYSSQ
ncbi:hypothetical protein PENTCL1PPCAC_7461, partial [Pristionchus entomophagus]